MNRSEYYETLKALAREIRDKHSLSTQAISLSSLRRVYKEEGIRIVNWPHRMKKVRGTYMVIDDQAYVMLNPGIKPKEPRIFTMAHELKHHCVDFELAKSGVLGCQTVSWSDGSRVEIGAEIFASEFIYPESECAELINKLGITAGHCSPEDVVSLKRQSSAPVSYRFLVKRLEWFHIAPIGEFANVQFQKLEEKLFGLPFYSRRRRRR